ncbi:MAG: type II toxin-antitoxin system VapC family toxin, partial [Chloroflexota bacterium]
MILVDSNVPMYLIGSDHPHKSDARRLLERLVSERQRLVTDAEVFQEILHRYVAIARRDAIQPAFDALRSEGSSGTANADAYESTYEYGTGKWQAIDQYVEDYV